MNLLKGGGGGHKGYTNVKKVAVDMYLPSYQVGHREKSNQLIMIALSKMY